MGSESIAHEAEGSIDNRPLVWILAYVQYITILQKNLLPDEGDIGFRVQFNAEFTSRVMDFP